MYLLFIISVLSGFIIFLTYNTMAKTKFEQNNNCDRLNVKPCAKHVSWRNIRMFNALIHFIYFCF